jgi:hypothetical protein
VKQGTATHAEKYWAWVVWKTRKIPD